MILLIVLQLLRRFTRFEIQDQAIWKIAQLMAYAMFLNLFLHGAIALGELRGDRGTAAATLPTTATGQRATLPASTI